jgi:hypothetical protein
MFVTQSQSSAADDFAAFLRRAAPPPPPDSRMWAKDRSRQQRGHSNRGKGERNRGVYPDEAEMARYYGPQRPFERGPGPDQDYRDMPNVVA